MSVRMYVGSAVMGVPQKNRTSVWSSNPITGFIYLRPKGKKNQYVDIYIPMSTDLHSPS